VILFRYLYERTDGQTDKQTDRPADTFIAILRNSTGSEVITRFIPSASHLSTYFLRKFAQINGKHAIKYWAGQQGSKSSDGVDTFFPKQWHLPRHRCQNARRAMTFRIRLRRDLDAVK